MAERTTDIMADVPGRNADGLWCRVEANTTGTTVDHPAGGWFVILYNDESDHSATHCDSMGAVGNELYRVGFAPVDVGWCVDNPPPWSEWTAEQTERITVYRDPWIGENDSLTVATRVAKRHGTETVGEMFGYQYAGGESYREILTADGRTVRVIDI